MQRLLVIAAVLISFGIGFMVGQIALIRTQKPNPLVNKVIDRSLDKYSIENLSKVEIQKAKFTVDKLLKDYPYFTSSEFLMEFNPNLDGKTMKKTSGLINIPKGKGPFPLLVMIRGFVDPKDYFIGNGTASSSIFFANHGFITVAPDFLGYGDSDKEPDNVFEARFQTYTTVLSLFSSLNSIAGWDGKNVFIWAHSNGGQITLTTLEITGKDYPTVLWAPVSASFPYSILYYSDEAEDGGKLLRRELSEFENVYNTDFYSLKNYLDRIKASIQIDQGTADDAVPFAWSDNLVKTLKKQDLEVNYNTYPGSDHNLEPMWNTAIQQDLEFFKLNLKN